MKNYFRNKKGFTLIELLVVVAIIGLLSSVVLASLNSARAKAKDVAIKEEMSQVANLMALNYNDYGSYCQIEPAVWVGSFGGTTNDCDVLLSNGAFYGTYAQKAHDLCKNIFDNAPNTDPGWGGSRLLIYHVPYDCPSNSNNKYSWTALLNNGNWYCSGSSGAKTESANYWDSPGCYGNP